MTKKTTQLDLDEDIKIGEGDETIVDWYHGFDVIDKLNERLWDAPEIEWSKIEACLTAYPEFVNRLEGLEDKRDLLKLFEEFPGASVCHSSYDHGSPGCSGFYLEAFVTKRHVEYAQNAFSALLEAIDGQLEKMKNLPESR